MVNKIGKNNSIKISKIFTYFFIFLFVFVGIMLSGCDEQVLTDIEITYTNVKLNYELNEDLVLTNLVVQGKLSNGDKFDITENDYEIDSSNYDKTKIGTYKIKVVMGQFEKTIEVTVGKISLSNAIITISNDIINYTGNKIEPNFIVKNKNITLIKNTDYSVNYLNNINAGIATINIVGIGDYTGNISETFTIGKASATSPNIDNKITTTCHSIVVEQLENALYSLNNGEYSNVGNFNNLNANTAYIINVKYAETASYFESAITSKTITTNEHLYGDWKTTTAPTCTESGIKEKECDECGEKITETISASGHTYDEHCCGICGDKALLLRITASIKSDSVVYSNETNVANKVKVIAYFSDNTSEEVFNYSATLNNNEINVAYTYTLDSYSETKNFTISNFTITPYEIVSITAEFNSGNNSIFTSATNEILKPYLLVKANYSDGTQKVINIDDIVLTKNLVSGNNTVRASYLTFQCTFSVNCLAVSINSISVTINTPQPIVFAIYSLSQIKATCLKVNATNNDGSSFGELSVEDYLLEFENSNSLIEGNNNLIVKLKSNNEINAVCSIYVTKKLPVSISGEIKNNATIYSSDLEVSNKIIATVLYNNREEGIVTNFTATLRDSQISIRYEENNVVVICTLSVQPVMVTLSSISATFDSNTDTIYPDIDINALKQYITVNGTNNDGSNFGVVSNYEIELPTSNLVAGNNEVKIKYNSSVFTTINVICAELKIVRIKAIVESPQNIIYRNYDLQKVKSVIKIFGVYNSGNDADEITEYILSFQEGKSELEIGNNTLNVSKTLNDTNFTTTIVVYITQETLASIAGTLKSDAIIYSSSSSVEDKFEVIAKYTNEVEKLLNSSEYNAVVDAENSKVDITYSLNGVTKTCSINIDITPVALDSISAIVDYNGKTIYSSATDNILKEILTVTGLNNDGSKYMVEESNIIMGYTITRLTDGFTNGANTLTLSYNGKEIEVSINITMVKVNGIEISYTQGSNIIYGSIEESEIKNLITIKETKNDGTTGKILISSEYSFGEYTKIYNSSTTIVVNYEEFSSTFEITFTKVEAISIMAEKLETLPTLYTSSSVSSLKDFIKLTLLYNDSTSEIITNYLITNSSFSVGENLIEIEYLEMTDTLSVNVVAVELSSITVSLIENYIIYSSSSSAEDKVVVEAHFNDLTSTLLNSSEYNAVVDAENSKVDITYSLNGVTKTCSINIDITPVALDSISAIVDYNGKTIYSSATDNTLKEILTVTGLNNDGSKYMVEESNIIMGYTITRPTDGFTNGANTLTLSYNGKEIEVSVNITMVTHLPSVSSPYVGIYGNDGIVSSSSFGSAILEFSENTDLFSNLKIKNSISKEITGLSFIPYDDGNQKILVIIGEIANYNSDTYTFYFTYQSVEFSVELPKYNS